MTSAASRLLTTLAIVAACAAPAWADATAFVGMGSAPEVRPAWGFAVGASLVIVGFEFEYARTREEQETLAPSLRTYMGNVLLQTPMSVGGVQLYGTAGAGVYRESLEDGPSETNVGTNIGGGVKITLTGPLRLRLDYRVFLLGGDRVYDAPKRFYAGLTLAF